MTISGSAALPPSPRSSDGRPRANGTSVCSLPLLSVAPCHCGDRRWHRTCGSHGHRPRQDTALFLDPAGARDLAKRLGSANPWGRTAFNKTDNILWQQQSSSREPIVGSASNLPVNTWQTDGACRVPQPGRRKQAPMLGARHRGHAQCRCNGCNRCRKRPERHNATQGCRDRRAHQQRRGCRPQKTGNGDYESWPLYSM